MENGRGSQDTNIDINPVKNIVSKRLFRTPDAVQTYPSRVSGGWLRSSDRCSHKCIPANDSYLAVFITYIGVSKDRIIMFE